MTLLRKLEITGFKSFATPTTFVFDRGITAIIGPNGSGKSNIAEALRWVLGEQSYSNLRGRRTEDVIFAGSDRRAAAGLAEASLTIDNSDGRLPIAFNEVTITRRASRSGENQYLINGSRVRLKDVQEVTAPLGQSHTIIGQGLVDAVLSQRPEDRRGLFEHAAGITGLRLQATQAERSLAEAEENAQRLHDIHSELAPRVRSLARAAKQAREYATVRSELQQLQRRHYGSLWRDQLARRRQARRAVEVAESALEAANAEQESVARTLADMRAKARDQQREIEEARERLTSIERQTAETRHKIELLSTEDRALEQRLGDIERLQAERGAEERQLRETIASLDEEIEALNATIAERTSKHDALKAENQAAQAERASVERRIRELDQELLRLSREGAEIEGALAGLADRQQQATDERQELEQRLERHAQLLTDTEEERDQLTGQIEHGCVDKAQAALDEAIAAADDLQCQLSEQQAVADQIEQKINAQQSRLEILERAHQHGEGLYAGVKTLLKASRRGDLQLPGLIGTVGEVIRTPSEYEVAIEVALGGRLQDVIVQTWSDAERGIQFLRDRDRGRATFLPLETIRDRRSPAVPDNPKVIGIASELIEIPDNLATVASHVLGGTLIVADLPAARQILKETRSWTIVTLAGELTRPSGSVTGGSRARTAGILARERERRALPKRIRELEAELSDQKDVIAAATTELATQRQTVEGLRRQLQQESERQRVTERELERRQSRVDQLQTEHERLERQQTQAVERHQGLEQQHGELSERRQRASEQRQQIEADRERLANQLAGQPSEPDARLAALATELATMTERQRATQRERSGAARRLQSIAGSHASQASEQQSLKSQRAENAASRTSAAEQLVELEAKQADAQAAIGPLIDAQSDGAEHISAKEQEADAQLERLRTAEHQHDQAGLDLARVQDEGVFLTERIHNDLEIEDPNALLAEAGETSEADEREIRRLRDRLRRMSAVGEDVLTEHEQEAERLAYLEGQLADVEQAATALRKVLGDLHKQMAERFTSTFSGVAAEFEKTFTRLFGGGAARLTLADDEVGAVDIVARPPGKRFQGLNQLSGGERALTAVSLLVAIQRVNPSPFALLDEVDAALDESNVVRFRDEIRSLTADTQFIIITHNRGTIEGADTLYGITMGADGASRVVSLRLDEAIRAVEEDESLESIEAAQAS